MSVSGLEFAGQDRASEARETPTPRSRAAASGS